MRILLSVVLILIINHSAYSAELITVDPNTPEAKREMVLGQKTDSRLAQKITCTLGYTRLHTAVEELSRLSGVAIRCGRNNDDWQVRDIPLVVYIKDLTLAKALEGLALATHTQLSISRIEDLVSYRYLRSSALEKQIAQYEPERQKAVTEGLKWDWDAVVKFSEMPESDFPQGSDYTDVRYAYAYTPYAAASARSLGAVFKLIGPEFRDQVASGQEFTVSTETHPALSAALREAARRRIDYTDNASLRQNGTPTDRSLTPDIDTSLVSLNIKRQKLSDSTFLELTMKIQGDEKSSGAIENLNSLVGRVTRYVRVADAAPRPQVPETPDVKAPEPMFVVPKVFDASEPEMITAKTIVPKPTTEGTMTAADAVVDLAKTAGISIICEDFLTHLNFGYAAWIYDKEQSVSESLRRLNPSPSYGNDPAIGEREWIVDTKNNLVLGRDKEWVKRHNNLIPENLVAWFVERLNGKGVVLDNLVPMLSLSDEQKAEWISFDKDLKPLRGAIAVMGLGQYSAIWKAYSGLNDDYRSMVGSESGVPVGIFDPAFMLPAINNLAGNDSWFSEELCGGAKELSEPEELKNFSLKLTRQASDGSTLVQVTLGSEAMPVKTEVPKDGKIPAHLDHDPALIQLLAPRIGLHRWKLVLKYNKGDMQHTWSAPSPDFPIFSPKRLEELKKEAEAKAQAGR